MTGRSSPRKQALNGHAVELFVSRSMLMSIHSKSVDADSATFRITSRSMMGLQASARHRKACLLHIPIALHGQKTTLQSLPMAYWDTTHHGHRKTESIDHTQEEDLKGPSRISLPTHQKREDHIDGPPDETQIRPSPASN